MTEESSVTPKKRHQKTDRKERVPLGTHRLKLQAETRAGYVRRFINGDPSRIQAAIDAGYQFVEDPTAVGNSNIGQGNQDIGSRKSLTVDRTNGAKAYLMEIPQEYYEADQAEKREKLDEVDRRIRGGKADIDKDIRQYKPDSAISFNARKGNIDD